MKQQKRIKLLFLGMVMSITMTSQVFADATQGTLDKFGDLSTIISTIIAFCSWGWVLLSKLAGVFLSNSFIFGDAFGIDNLLWNLRNICKNIANFGLGFLFIYKIGSNLLEAKNEVFNFKKTFLPLMIAGLGIQISWFLCATLVDLSTIGLAGVSGMATQVMEVGDKSSLEKVWDNSRYKKIMEEGYQTGGIHHGLKIGKGKDGFPEVQTIDLAGNEGSDGEAMTTERILDSFLPNRDDFSGPLVFFGLHLYDLTKANEHKVMFGSRSQGTTEVLQGFVRLIFDGVITIVFYTITLFVICVIGLLRMILLRGFIIFSPLLILLSQFPIGGKNEIEVGSIKFGIKIKGFFSLVFWPIFACGGLLLAEFMFSTLLSAIPDTGGIDLNDLHCTAMPQGKDGVYDSTCTIGEMFSFGIRGLRNPVLKVIMNLLGVWLMWIILKWSMPSTGIDQLDKLINDKNGGGMLGITESFIKSMPMIPTPAGELSLSTIGKQIDKFSNGRGFASEMFNKWNTDSEDAIRAAMGLNTSKKATENWYNSFNIENDYTNFPSKVSSKFRQPKFEHIVNNGEKQLVNYVNKCNPRLKIKDINELESEFNNNKPNGKQSQVRDILKNFFPSKTDLNITWEKLLEMQINPQTQQPSTPTPTPPTGP